MSRSLVSLLVHLGANAVALFVADLLLGDLSIRWQSFIFAVLIFSIVEALVEPFLAKMAANQASAIRGGVALAATFIGLVVTNLLSSGFRIRGFWTWLIATLIVWVGALAAGAILRTFFKGSADANA